MTAFDETLFRVVPALYRSLDRALNGPESGRAAAAAAPFLRFGSWIGADRDGNPFVTADVTKQTAVIQAEHVLRALENATARIGRALTVHAGGAQVAGSEPRRRARARRTGVPGSARRDHGPLAAGAVPRVPPLRRAAAARHPRRPDRPARPAEPGPAWPTRARRSSSLTCAWCSGHWPRRARPAGVRRAAAPALAGGDVRLPPGRARDPPAQRGARPRAARARIRRRAVGADPRGPRDPPGHGLDPGPVRRRTPAAVTWSASPGPRPTSRPSRARAPRLPGRAGPELDVVPLFESGADLENATRVLDEMLRLEPVATRPRPPGGGLRSCSATRTRPRNSARPAPPCGCSARSSGSAGGRRRTAFSWSCSTAAAGRRAAAAGPPGGRCSPSRAAR